jgi:GNAT superfamily N-acetyltransferase
MKLGAGLSPTAHEPSDPSIRRGERRDVARLVGLWLQLMDYHRARDARFAIVPDADRIMDRRFRRILSDSDSRLLVSEAGDRIVGFVVGHIDLNVPVFPGRTIGFIADLFVEEDFRRQGRARGLVNVLMEWFRSRKVTSIQLHAASCNPGAHEFWQQVGFKDFLIRMSADV